MIENEDNSKIPIGTVKISSSEYDLENTLYYMGIKNKEEKEKRSFEELKNALKHLDYTREKQK